MKRGERLDVRLVREGLAATRSQAQALILAGQVRVNQKPVTKAGTWVDEADRVAVDDRGWRYVSRGGVKLEYALRRFGLSPQGWEVVDIGASTGGFTDCWLQHGARAVWAVDVGRGQLHWRLRQDPRVTVREGLNARYLTLEQLGRCRPFAAASIDVSFIGVGRLFAALQRVVATGGAVVALIKPQFEAGPRAVGKGGVVRDPHVHREVLEAVVREADGAGLGAQAVAPSPIRGGSGNREFLILWRLGQPSRLGPDDLDGAVREAWSEEGDGDA
ncbi:MAG: TlyA family RNA methyltransferase [Firmicutes bacterium]|nr:TlyA family RNA methyltransferase [Alicyclobacillaceae bacterium]MCL6496682.1 TlyA family RNA methyltransferase [Bacillota bacterium]